MSPDVGKMIRETRQARGISLRQLASQVGIHFSHLSKIENGKDKIGRESLKKIAEELGVDSDLMLGEAGHQATPFRVLGDRICALGHQQHGLPVVVASVGCCHRSNFDSRHLAVPLVESLNKLGFDAGGDWLSKVSRSDSAQLQLRDILEPP